MAARYSNAVVQLAAEASALSGVAVTPREVERWRQRGLVPRPKRRFGGGGSESIYPEGASNQIAEIASLLQSGWRLDELAVPLFLGGFDVDEETVKSAFKAHADRARHLITRRADGSDTVTLAEAATKTLVRSMRGTDELQEWKERVSELAKSLGESPAAIVESALMNFIHLLVTGEPITDDGFAEFRLAVGLDGLVEHLGAALGEDITSDEVNDVLMKLDLAQYVRLVDQFTLSELAEARTVALEMAQFAVPMAKVVAAQLNISTPDNFDSTVAGMVESTTTFGLPLLAWLLHRNKSGVAEVLDALRANAAALEAISRLTDAVPQRWWHLLGPNSEAALEALTPDERTEFYESVSNAFAQDSRLGELRASLMASQK